MSEIFVQKRERKREMKREREKNEQVLTLLNDEVYHMRCGLRSAFKLTLAFAFDFF